MKITLNYINSLLSKSFPQITMKRCKHGFYLFGGRASQIDFKGTFWKKLSDINLDSLKSEAEAFSFTKNELKSNLKDVNCSIEEERQKIKACLSCNEPLDADVFNLLIAERKEIMTQIKEAA